MSDLWPCSSLPPIIHPSSLSQSSPFTSSSPSLSSPSSPGNHGNAPHTEVPSYHLTSQTQISSPHLPEAQVTSPHHLPPPQVTSLHLSSPHIVPETQVTSPHLHNQPQPSSPHLFPQTQETSPHIPHHQVTSPYLPHHQVTSPYLPNHQVTSPHLFPQTQVTSPHLPHHQVTSPHLPHHQVTSPHLPHHQVTSPYLPHHQVTSPHLFPQTQVTSPHLPHHQVTSPHLPHHQVTSPHLPHHQVTSPHIPHHQVTSPHLLHHQVTSPHHPHHQVTSPHPPHHQVTSPHLLSLPHLSSQNHDPGSDHPSWSRAEPPSEPSYLLRSCSYSRQNQTTAHLDLQLQNENQFSTGGTHHRDELEDTHRLPYNTHTLLTGDVYKQGDTPGPVQDTWRPPGPTLSQLQCSSLDSMSEEVTLGRLSSVEFGSSPAEDFSSTQFFHDSCHDKNGPQPFCSPNTPGLSPHYPQTPTISSPVPQMHPREERVDFHTQASRQLSRDKTLSCCRQEYDTYPLTSDPGQHHLRQTNPHLLRSQNELIQDQTGLLDAAGNSESSFSPQGRGEDGSSTAQPPGPPAECGGGGGGGRGGGNDQTDWTWIKRPKPKNSAEVGDCRLLCTLCKRDFSSLPALNGHMRSHSGSRSVTWLNKGEDSSPLVPASPVSMAMPVNVPVQSRGSAQGRCSRLAAASRRSVLYRSLLHLKDEDEVVSGGGDDGVVTGGDGVHYTPPPMLCPLRAGPGLYCSLTSRRQQRVQTVQLHNTHTDGLNDLVAMETASPPPGTLTTGTNKPRINVGRGLQAEIPPLQGRGNAHFDSHNALLLWTPQDELEHPVNKQRVEALLMMASSSVVPGGGASPESALHVLSECRGDFLLTVEKLLSAPETSNNNQTAQQHPSVSWSAAEKTSLLKSLQLHHKDFGRIQKAVQTKSLSQCVEFYYLWKKKLSLSARTPARLTVTARHKCQRSSKMS
ncbi:uncharacterized protein LOC121627595 [Chelmon rostratus]|uniref:uncharacterized protein LOC121627595 n=1 Tax=Chelmon rostratus TaxID=109905 RepID=UPI001BEBDA48|nr:uncharacterized protein LOC121627595 [Chelmon rostratus]